MQKRSVFYIREKEREGKNKETLLRARERDGEAAKKPAVLQLANQNDLPGLTGVAVEAGVVPKANVGAGVDVDVPKPVPNDISDRLDRRRLKRRIAPSTRVGGELQHGRRTCLTRVAFEESAASNRVPEFVPTNRNEGIFAPRVLIGQSSPARIF